MALRHLVLEVPLSLVTVAVLLAASAVSAQPSASLSGVVADAEGSGVPGAMVSIANTMLTARTNDRGEFRILGIVPGVVEIRVRRLGFAPMSQMAEVAGTDASNRVNIRLVVLPAMLDHVVVQRSRISYTGRLAGFHQRLERRSSGQFITRDEMDRNEGRSLSQLLSKSPGVSAVQLRTGGGAVRLRGRTCRPLVWLDGVPMPAAEVDLDAFPVSTLHGVELYLGSTTAPLDYTAQQNRSSCGSILLWSRGRDTESDLRPKKQTVDIEALVASLSVYSADQVDRRAELRNNERVEAAYPPDLFASGVSGSVVVEFVVDSKGAMEPGTFTVVSSTHQRLAAAVIQALERSAFVPAVKNGGTVRQFVRQRFDFAPKSVRISAVR